MNSMYGFEGEVKQKYSEHVSRLFTDTFNYLPLAHILHVAPDADSPPVCSSGAGGLQTGAGDVLVMHGGLFSDDNVTVQDILAADRVRQPPETGLMCDILWSDPQPQPGTYLLPSLVLHSHLLRRTL